MNSVSYGHWVFSDMHLDHANAYTLVTPPAHDVAINAGDFDGPLSNAVEWAVKFPHYLGPEPVIIVPGNHDFYGVVMQDEIAKAKAIAAGSNVHVLDCDSVIINGIRYVGATLWTNFSLYGNAPRAMAAAQFGMSDFGAGNIGYRVPGLRHPQKMLAEHSLQLHRQHYRYLDETLSIPHDGPTVVIVHHGVSKQSVPAHYAGDPLSPAFSSDLEHLFLRHQPELVVHGHTHSSLDYMIGDRTRVLCNPKGYGPAVGGARPENLDFNETLVIGIDVPTPTMGYGA